MKKSLLVVGIMVFFFNFSFSQEKNKLNVGFHLSQFQKDFGIGVHVISPYMFNKVFAIKLGGNLQWLEHLNDDGHTTWTTYQNLQLGFRGKQDVIKDRLFLYGEGGLLLLLPNSKFSSNKFDFGGYGLFGFEFISLTNFVGYFIEMGGVGTGARADKVANQLIYSNGFLINTGVRFKF